MPSVPKRDVRDLSAFAERSKLLATWIELIGLAAAGLFAVVQYMAHTADVRVEKTIDFLKSWSSEPVAGCYARISAVWNDEGTKKKFMSLVDETFDDPDAMEPGRKLGDFVLATIKKNQLDQPIYRLNEFYATVSACVKRDICDRSLAAEFFCADALAFNERTQVLTSVKRERDPNYAQGLRDFLGVCRMQETQAE